MGRNRHRNKIFKGVKITGMADRGKVVGRNEEGEVVFVEGAVPGDIVDVKVLRKKKGTYQGIVETYIHQSDQRKTPFCEHFEDCGGCKWQHFAYEGQLEQKAIIVKNALERIGKVEIGETLPIVGGANDTFYRNKLEFTFSNKSWLTAKMIDTDVIPENRNALGFHAAGVFDKIIDVNKCWLQAEPSNAIRNHVRQYAFDHELSFFDIRNHVGLLRNMVVRLASTGDLMIILSFFDNDMKAIKALLDNLHENFPAISSLMYVINQKMNDTILDQDIILYKGEPFITEQLGHVKFQLGPKSFFQTNTQQGTRLYEITRDFAGLTGEENVYDLYTGLGSIACFLAENAKHVIGIEEVEAAIEDAKKNATLNGINNTTFYAGDVKDILDEAFITKHGLPDVIITDPPRAGMHAKVIETLLTAAAPRIVYVSCNPSTQARDLQLLSEKYTVLKSQAVDMFPHTHHIENVVLLELKEIV